MVPDADSRKFSNVSDFKRSAMALEHALVREYLTRQGLKDVLRVFDEEVVRIRGECWSAFNAPHE